MEQVGVEGQRKINASHVLIVGVGGLGSPVLQQLAGAGVGTITVVDHDVVEIHNLNRQYVHSEKTIGSTKVTSAREFIGSYNPNITLHLVEEKFTVTNAAFLLQDVDIVVDCTDNFATRYLLNDSCVMHNKPLVYGSILGFEGQLAVFNLHGSGNLRDIFPEEPQSTVDCDSLGVLGPLPGLIGNMMAMEVLKIILGLETLKDKFLVLDALTWQSSVLKYR